MCFTIRMAILQVSKSRGLSSAYCHSLRNILSLAAGMLDKVGVNILWDGLMSTPSHSMWNPYIRVPHHLTRYHLDKMYLNII